MNSNLNAIDKDTYALRDLTFPKVLERRVSDVPDKTFLAETATDRHFTYRQMGAWSNRVANALAGLGVGKGQHTAIFMGNSAEYLAVFFGLGKLGVVSVPINTAARGELLRYYISQSDCSCVIADASLAERLKEVLPTLPLIKRVVIVRTDGGSWSPPAFPGTYDVADFDELLSAASDVAPSIGIKCSDLLMLAYTSGTTGPSKGSMLSHAAALTYGTGAAEVHGYRQSDIFYVCLPLFHNNALLATSGSALVCGASVVLSRRFSVSKFWQEIRDSRATITNFLGSMSSFLWSQPSSTSDADNELRLVSMAPTPKYVLEFEKRFGLKAMNNYGLSDFGMATSFTEHDPREKCGSIGRSRRGIQVKIVDEDDFELPAGEVGEIVLQSDEPWRAATGYYKMPEATNAAHRNQWFHTGDRGKRDADGYIWFVDRKKDCIRRRGENISAYEVEQILAAHSDIAIVAVFPVTAETNDEEVAAVIVRRPGTKLTEENVVAHCQSNMAYFMVPRYIQFRDELPTTVNQKIEKFKLRCEFEGALSEVWDREAAGVALTR